MAKFNGRIVAVQNNGAPTWQSPDGQKKLWAVTVEVNGRQLAAKTWDQALSVVGYSGEIEAYEKQDKRGNLETWVAPPRAQQSGGYQARSGGDYKPKDETAIKAMWAIGQAVECIGSDLAQIETYAHELFAMVERIKAGKPVETPTVAEPVTSELNSLFGGAETVSDESSPWPNQ